MSKKVSKFIYWTPRILSVIFILFITLFSFDIFSLQLGFWQTILGLLIHNIPVFVLLVVLLISWRYEIVGGIVFILAGISYIILTLRSGITWYIALSWSLTIAGPAFLIGILFLVNWFQKKK